MESRRHAVPLSSIGMKYDPHMFYVRRKIGGKHYLLEGTTFKDAARSSVRAALPEYMSHMLVFVKKGVIHAMPGGPKRGSAAGKPRRSKKHKAKHAKKTTKRA